MLLRRPFMTPPPLHRRDRGTYPRPAHGAIGNPNEEHDASDASDGEEDLRAAVHEDRAVDEDLHQRERQQDLPRIAHELVDAHARERGANPEHEEDVQARLRADEDDYRHQRPRSWPNGHS